MTLRTIVRGAGRVTIATLVAGVIGLCALQFEQILVKNVALAHEVANSRQHSSELRERIAHQRGAIARLRAPGGAIPEIHDELQLVGPHEEIIYVHGAPPETPDPVDWSGR